MSRFQELKDLFKRRLINAARADLFGHFERSISGVEREIDHKRKLLNLVLNPDIKLQRTECPTDAQQLLESKEEVPPEQKEWSSSLDQEDPEPPHIKEEQEELWTSQEGEQLQGLEEADITMFTFTPVPMKNENDEKKPQTSQLHQRQTEQMKTEADGEDCGGSEPARNSHPDRHLQPDDKTSDCSEPDTDDSDDQRETSEPQSGLNNMKISPCGKKDCVSCVVWYFSSKPYSCFKCGKEFGHKRSLIIHQRIHAREKPFSCAVCGKRFVCQGYLRTHMRIHTGEKPFSCSVCDKSFTQKSGLEYHLKTHTGEKLQVSKTGFNEENCGGSKQAKKLNPHRHSKPDTDKKTLVSFETNGSADIAFWKETRQHQSVVTYQRNKDISLSDEGCKADKKPFSCSDDKAKIEPKTDTSVDSEFCKQPRCQTCLNDLKSGEVSVSDVEFNTDKKPSSSESHKRFDDFQNLQTQTTCHTGEKLLNCIVCQKRFTLESELRSHNCDGESSQLHQSQTEEQITAGGENSAGEETFCCSVCNKGFSESKSLVKHMRVHTDQKPFSCLICGKGFTWRRYLTKHMEVHKNRCFSCTQCGRKFGSERQLHLHIVIHNRQKPYSCSVCGEKFARCEKLRIHMRHHTGEELKAADITKFPSSLVLVKSEDDDEEKPQSSQLHQRQTEQMKTEADGEDCGGSEPARNSHPDRHLQPDTNDKTSDSSEPDTDDSDFWTQTRQSQSDLNSMKNKVSESDIECDADKASESFNPHSDDSVDSDFWKDTRECLSGLNSEK